MATFDPPPQVDRKDLPPALQDWLRRFYLRVLGVSGSGLVWTNIDFTGSNIADIVTRSITSLSGTLTAAQFPALTGDTTTTAGSLATTTGTYASWTPADNSGASLAFTSVSANYTKIGNMVFAYATWSYPVTASGANASISGLPFTSANANYAQVPSVVDTSASITGGLVLVPIKNTTTASFDVGTPFGPATNLQLSAATIAVMLHYPIA